MGFKADVSAIPLLLLLAFSIQAQSTVFDVTKYGANEDITEALSLAWKEACASTNPTKILIPKGTYLLGRVTLKGECKAPIELQVEGTLKAPIDPSSLGDSWVTFAYIDRLTLSGGGTFDGQGQVAWSMNNCGKNKNCMQLPISLRFNFITNGIVQGVTSLNSKNFHINVMGCKNLTFQHLTVTAPGDSRNTDGIHIGSSSEINIVDTNIGTGDDCVSIGFGSKQIKVTGVTCGPGHGISVGSLGKYPDEAPVSGIFVRNCTITGSDNGVRIKTWPALFGGIASDMHFEDIIMNNVRNPIIIDQTYCPWNQCNLQAPSRVRITNVSFKNIRGTSATPEAVHISCSSGIPCEIVELCDIDLAYNGTDGPAKSLCTNVKPILTGKLNPLGC
ncbi:hypothetical protein Tsubulata_041234 [Turnera subulata]|uniref:Exopolygalacturonase-like n=1 Tax=Turnera subulata TaxID=218843 RepID=A0A9Q0FF88_9ROSI|nr:hypothetical protein Tsubulata_041234 [Turnera subulata]